VTSHERQRRLEKGIAHELRDLAYAWESLGVLPASQARVIFERRIPHLRRLIGLLEGEFQNELDRET
jgi:hypothetical protein